MELARQRAEERARLDEEEWHQEELRLREEEEWRRAARAVREADERRREADALEAEQRDLDVTVDADLDVGASAGTLDELLALQGNQQCFDCDSSLTEEDGSRLRHGRVWWSLTHGTLLCTDCARIHHSLGTQTSVVRCADGEVPSELPELDVLYAGGNEAFAAFLAEEGMGVSRRVWLALPLETRYQTPAADLYQRRLRALVDGETTLPTDLRPAGQVASPAPGTSGVAANATVDAEPSDRAAAEPSDKAAAQSPSQPPLQPSCASVSWQPPEFVNEEHGTNTDYMVAMAAMRRRIDEAKAANANVYRDRAPERTPGDQLL